MRTFSLALSFLLIFTVTLSPVLAATDGFKQGASASELRDQYANDKIRILIAAGHEPGYGGAVYQGMYEREIVTDIADELKELLDQNPRYEVIVTRDNDRWNKSLARYFTKEKKAIQKFVKTQKKATQKLEKRGKLEERTDGGVAHATAPEDVALRLYGINRWANENDIDLIVNLHVNDAPDHGQDAPSKYTGYAVYIPDTVYGNHKTSKELARSITARLKALGDTSTLPGESTGVVPDRDLIAIGAYGTLNVPSVLIEYGYISEPRFTLPEYRRTVTRDAAYQTYLALQDFFKDPVASPRAVAKLPSTWPEPEPVATTTATTTPVVTPPTVPSPTACAAFTKTLLPAKSEDEKDTTGDVARLQRILAKDKTIYPEGLVTGYFGPATRRAVEAFQKKQGIVATGTPETTGFGAVGPRTAKALIALCTP